MRWGMTRYQWTVFFAAWLGWGFDVFDGLLFNFVAPVAVPQLLGVAPGDPAGAARVVSVTGLVTSALLIGWATGGILFGWVTDRVGRARTLQLTIVTYALATAACALAPDIWTLVGLRFIASLGIGGEWAAGAALVAEVWPEEKRAKAAGILQSAWAAGFLIAAVVNLLMRESGWRPIFVVGIAPAVVALFVRLWVKEPERWLKTHEQEQQPGAARSPKLAELFQPRLLRSTLVGSGLAFVAVFGLWGATNWTPTLVRSLPELQSSGAAALAAAVSYATMLLNAGALAGYLSFGPLAERFGRRAVFALMCLGSLVMLPVTFLTPRSYAQVLLLLPLLGFFNNGIFSGFPIYLPELYPTRIRATGAGFCFNVGRVLASAGPFLTGFLVTALGGFGRAASAIALIYVVGLAILPFAPETKGQPLPE